MSRKLGAFTLALGILVGSMAFKSALTNQQEPHERYDVGGKRTRSGSADADRRKS